MIRMRDIVKYLGITLDGRLTVSPYFVGRAPRVEGVVVQLIRLLRNLSSLEHCVRRLYKCSSINASVRGTDLVSLLKKWKEQKS